MASSNLVDVSRLTPAQIEALGESAIDQVVRETYESTSSDAEVFARFDNSTGVIHKAS